ncbi:MAG: hypothetical protein C4K58_00600 [Flavobacteriaceae bacterium]|nr:MAG: hypothetical protein C4K58_00600 [Flavobacteriaceae bacterium]
MKNLFTLGLFALSLGLQAQMTSMGGSNERYIEVKVTDTLMVKPDVITLNVSLKESRATELDYYGYEDELEWAAAADAAEAAAQAAAESAGAPDAPVESVGVVVETERDYEAERKERMKKMKLKKETAEKENEKQKKQLEAIFKKHGVTYLFHPKDYGSKLDIYENAYEVTIKNPAVYQKLQKDLESLENVSTFITETTVLDKEKHELLLIEKTMKKANREASAIAKAMGVTLGAPLNVSNQNIGDIYTSLFDSVEKTGIGSMFSMFSRMFGGTEASKSVLVLITKSLVVRYSIL